MDKTHDVHVWQPPYIHSCHYPKEIQVRSPNPDSNRNTSSCELLSISGRPKGQGSNVRAFIEPRNNLDTEAYVHP